MKNKQIAKLINKEIKQNIDSYTDFKNEAMEEFWYYEDALKKLANKKEIEFAKKLNKDKKLFKEKFENLKEEDIEIIKVNDYNIENRDYIVEIKGTIFEITLEIEWDGWKIAELYIEWDILKKYRKAD